MEQKYCRSDEPFSVHHIWGYVVPIGIIGDVQFDHLAKVVSARIVHYKLTIFSFVITKYLEIDTI